MKQQVKIEEKSVHLKSGTILFYRRWKPAHKEPTDRVVMFHSVFFDNHFWDDLAEHACLTFGMEVYCFDLIGHGKSSKNTENISLDSITEDVVDAVQSLLIAPFHYVGCSISCEWGLRMAISHPDYIKSLAISGPSSLEPTDEDRENVKQMINNWRRQGVPYLVDFLLGEPFFFGSRFLTDSAFAQEREKQRAKLLAMDFACVDLMAIFITLHLTVDYSQVNKPTLIMCGDSDMFFMPHAENLHTLITNSELEMIPYAAHEAPLENPAHLNATVTGFWKKLMK